MAEQKDDTHRYDDIIGLPHHQSKTHPQMSNENRAAQFSPFAALTGYGDCIDEAGRLTSDRVELDESQKAVLDQRISMLLENLAAKPMVVITYFMPDKRKSGGAYLSIKGQVKKIDEYTREVIFVDGTAVPIDEIVEIKGDLFSAIDSSFA